MLKNNDRCFSSRWSPGRSITTTIETRQKDDPSETVGLSLTHAGGLMSAHAQIHDRKQGIEFKQVLVATDFSDGSRRALAYAIAIARRFGSELSVVHALP